jgi:hypothetical protein
MPLAYSGQRVTAAVIASSYTESDFTSFTAASTSFVQIANSYSIAAGEPNAGSIYRLRAYGNGTQGTTAQSLEFAASFGGLTTGLGLTFSSTFAGTSTAFNWWVEAEALCESTGSGAQWQVSLTGMCGVGGAALSGTVQSTGTLAVSTASAIPFFIEAKWGSTTGSPSAGGLRSALSRLL